MSKRGDRMERLIGVMEKLVGVIATAAADELSTRTELGRLAEIVQKSGLSVTQEVRDMGLTIADVKANLQAANAKLDASLQEVKAEIHVLQGGGVSQEELTALNEIANSVVDKAQQFSDIIPNTPGAPTPAPTPTPTPEPAPVVPGEPVPAPADVVVPPPA